MDEYLARMTGHAAQAASLRLSLFYQGAESAYRLFKTSLNENDAALRQHRNSK
ncbi:hypothetical protein ABWL39_10645 [Chitinivorax sp. PXF-14]|uniref:hypothetical protein n=1 Tax=Chitinivorax sp. PXF-14 TaxID=3230488 RepID=UPI003465308C